MIGVSGDPQDVNDRFRESLDLPYTLVGDPERKIIRAYDVRWPVIGMTQRVTYVISPDRKVRIAFHSELDMGAHSATACRTLAQTPPSA